MPILATLLSTLLASLANFFVRWFSFGVSMRLALYTTWMVTFSAFLTAVYICINGLYSQISVFSVAAPGGASWVRLFFVGLGMVIPSNAGAVIACVSSVWIATAIYKVKKQGLFLISGAV